MWLNFPLSFVKIFCIVDKLVAISCILFAGDSKDRVRRKWYRYLVLCGGGSDLIPTFAWLFYSYPIQTIQNSKNIFIIYFYNKRFVITYITRKGYFNNFHIHNRIKPKRNFQFRENLFNNEIFADRFKLFHYSITILSN